MEMSTPQIRRPASTLTLYFRTLVFSLVLFGVCYAYTSWLKIPGVLNKSVADTAIVLIGISMILSGASYFWHGLSPLVHYRKYVGLAGWAFGLVHFALSFSAFQALALSSTWEKGAQWPAFTGFLATIIFTIMAAISNMYMTRFLGAKWWRITLRTGYIAMLLIFAHVFLLKSARWITWYQGGMKTPPSMSLIVTIFMVVVMLVRIALEISLRRRARIV